MRTAKSLALQFLLFSFAIAGCASGGPPATAPSTVPPEAGPSAASGAATAEQQAGAGAPVGSRPAETVAAQQETATQQEAAAQQETTAIESPDPGALRAVEAEPSLDEALVAYESSRDFWQRGDFELALAELDRAYELMVGAPVDEDSLEAQEREDLRHLISRRVIEIYASRRTVVADRSSEIPIEINEYVEREIKRFQGPERKFFLQSYERSGLYRPMIVEALREAGMPEELSWLPLVESGYKVRALSSARALGLWQFIASTGYRYDLNRNDFVDERMDPEKATHAALAYLGDLHNLFGDWMTALAAYNCGETRVQRQISRQRAEYFDHFWDVFVMLPRETRRYVPRMLATLAIVNDPEAYGFELPEPLSPVESELLKIERSVSLKDLDKALRYESGTLAALNPELRHGATPPDSYELRIPADAGETVLASITKVPSWADSGGLIVHRVQRGETLSGIAGRYRTSVNSIMAVNNLRSANRISIGQRLTIRGAGGASRRTGTVVATGSNGEVRYSVRRGDSLWKLASRFGTTVDTIRRDNGLGSNMLRPGQGLVIRGGSSTTVASSSGAGYTVRRGDTLGKIATRLQVPLNALLAANGLNRRSTIYPGQTIRTP